MIKYGQVHIQKFGLALFSMVVLHLVHKQQTTIKFMKVHSTLLTKRIT